MAGGGLLSVAVSSVALSAAYVFWMRSWALLKLAWAHMEKKRKLKRGELDAMRELGASSGTTRSAELPKAAKDSHPILQL